MKRVKFALGAVVVSLAACAAAKDDYLVDFVRVYEIDR